MNNSILNQGVKVDEQEKKIKKLEMQLTELFELRTKHKTKDLMKCLTRELGPAFETKAKANCTSAINDALKEYCLRTELMGQIDAHTVKFQMIDEQMEKHTSEILAAAEKLEIFNARMLDLEVNIKEVEERAFRKTNKEVNFLKLDMEGLVEKTRKNIMEVIDEEKKKAVVESKTISGNQIDDFSEILK